MGTLAAHCTRENLEWAETVEYAKSQSDWSFVELILNDYYKKRLGGVEILKLRLDSEGNIPYTHKKQRQIFEFDKIGGELVFERQKGGRYTVQMLITDHNKNFLASHLSQNIWRINNTRILNDVKAREKKLKTELIINPEIEEAHEKLRVETDPVKANALHRKIVKLASDMAKGKEPPTPVKKPKEPEKEQVSELVEMK